MKTKVFRFLICILVTVLAVGMASCKKDKKKCSDSKPYYCSSSKGCCAYQYSDLHGTCFNTLEGCRKSGFACETCHIEK